MKRTHEAEERIRRIIRDSIAVDPLISLRSLQDVLQRRNFQIGDLNYISKLRKKVETEALANIDRSEINPRLAKTQERFRLIFGKLNQIAFWPRDAEEKTMPPTYKDQIAALKALAQLDIALLSAEMDAGIFTRHIGLVEEQRRFVPLPPEQVDMIMGAFKAWGIGPGATLAMLKPARDAEARVIKVFNLKK
jgi:hypothetical protein